MHHKRLQSFALARCRNVKEVNLQCLQLQALTLEECEELGKAVLKPVGVKTLTLGGFAWALWVGSFLLGQHCSCRRSRGVQGADEGSA